MNARTRAARTVGRLAGAVVYLVRRGRPVAWTPEWAGFGNQALLWFWAWRGRDWGEERSVLRTPAMAPWLELFPAAIPLTTAPGDVGFLSRRLVAGQIPGDGGAPMFARDWTPRQLASFVDEVFLSSTRFAGLRESAAVGADDLVVNVRRGDYYSPANISVWGFDQVGYVRAAVEVVARRRPVARVVVVSDDVGWCERELAWPPDLISRIDLVPASDGPARNLASLVAARRLVVTNSTFSYWGGYIGDVLHGTAREVIAPDFFNRSLNRGRAWLIDPSWTVLNEGPVGSDPWAVGAAGATSRHDGA